MACVGGTTGNETAQKFLESLQNDLRNLSIETKKKFPQIKEVRKLRRYKMYIFNSEIYVFEISKVMFLFFFALKMFTLIVIALGFL
jgi:hypothetical protein